MKVPSYLNNGGEIEYFKWDPLDEGYEDIDGNFLEIDAEAYFDKIDSIFERSDCPYCRGPLTQFYHRRDPDKYAFDEILSEYSIELRLCRWCYYWCYRLDIWFEMAMFTGPIHSLALSKAATYKDIHTECNHELSRYLRQREEIWHQLPPAKIEKLVADVYRAHFPDSEVLHVGRPADGGKDIILVDADGDKSLIEIKARQSPDYVEPVHTLRNLLGVMVGGEDRALKGIVVSTCDHYSYQAKKFAGGLADTAYSIELTDRGKLARMLSPLAKTDRFMEPVSFDGANEEFKAIIKKRLIG